MLRKIETAEIKEKREKRKMFIGISIGLIMVLSSIAFIVIENYNTTEEKRYGNYVFIKQDNLWRTKVNGETISTYFLPQEVEQVTSDMPFISRRDFSGKAVFIIAKTQEERQAATMFSKYISPLRMQYACAPGDTSSECSDLPEKSCETILPSEGLIIVQDTTSSTNSTSIKYSSACLTIEGNQETLEKAVEKAIFLMLGVISK